MELAAYPAPQIVWLLNGQQIKPSQRHKVTYEQNIASLMIYNVQPSDRGDYMMKAVNEAGQTACKTTLFVKRKLHYLKLLCWFEFGSDFD